MSVEQITEECKVIKIKKNLAVIELERKPECENCKACSFNRRNTVRMNARLETECSAGDRVIVEMPQKAIKGSSILLFFVPLMLMLAAVFATASQAWYIQIPSVVGALIISLGLIFLFDKLIRRNAAYMPTVKQIVKNTNHIGETNDRSQTYSTDRP